MRNSTNPSFCALPIVPTGATGQPLHNPGVFYFMKKKEIWKDIPGYKGYYKASSLGRIKSLPRMVNHNIIGFKKMVNVRFLKKKPGSDGYACVDLYKKNVSERFRVSRLVMLSFRGKSTMQIDHINCIINDDRLVNLRYCTAFENASIFRNTINKSGIKNIVLKRYRSGTISYFFSLRINKERYFGKPHLCIHNASMDLLNLYYAFPELQHQLKQHELIKTILNRAACEMKN